MARVPVGFIGFCSGFSLDFVEVLERFSLHRPFATLLFGFLERVESTKRHDNMGRFSTSGGLKVANPINQGGASQLSLGVFIYFDAFFLRSLHFWILDDLSGCIEDF